MTADRTSGDGPCTGLARDLPASIAVFLVALPSPLGISVASGVSPMSGRIAAIVSGIVVVLARAIGVDCTQAEGGCEVRDSGYLRFLAVPTLVARLRELPAGTTVRMLFEVEGIDHVAIEAIRGWRIGYEKSGGRVVKDSLDGLWRELHGKPAA